MKNKLYDYFDWLRDFVDEEDAQRARFLNGMEYHYHYILDKNRATAGILMRTRYAEEYGVVLDDIQGGPASVFEVLVALAFEFARNADISESLAYHEMLKNLGIDEPDLERGEIQSKIYRWLSGQYGRQGDGTPFPLHEYDGDCRNIDLWTAMTLYINEVYPIEKDWINKED